MVRVEEGKRGINNVVITDTETGEQMACGIIVPTTHPVGENLYYLSNCYMGIPTTYFNDEETDKVIHLILEDLP